MLITEDGLKETNILSAMFKFLSLEPGDHIITVSNTNADVVMFITAQYICRRCYMLSVKTQDGWLPITGSHRHM